MAEGSNNNLQSKPDVLNVTKNELLDKMEVDYTAECDEKIPKCKEIAAAGNITEALDMLLTLEKQTRNAADMISNSRALLATVEICYEAKNWKYLNEHIMILSKRRSQLKQAIAKMIQRCCEYVDEIQDKNIKLELINTLRDVTEGKIYVEVERARLTHKLAMLREEEGDIAGAANVMQELHLETYGSIGKQEKVELILEQMRLALAKGDHVRSQIISKKINTKYFEEENPSMQLQELKLKYYGLMINLDQRESDYLSVCKHYRAMLTTEKVLQDTNERKLLIENVVLFVVLAPYSNEQVDLAHRVLESNLLLGTPTYKELLKLFMSAELICWNKLCEKYEHSLKGKSSSVLSGAVFDMNTETGRTQWNDLKKRVIEHNITIIAKYYTRITLARMSELLDLPFQETEKFLSDMVVNKTITAKTDRPAGIVNFGENKDANAVLNDWADNVASLMRLVNNTTHLINKEHMLHKHMLTS